MKLTKYIQSCVLVEGSQYTAVFDPDSFTWGAKLFDIASLQKLDYILITHVHQDHFSLDFVKALVGKFPDVKIITTNEVAAELKQNNIQNVTTSSDENVSVVDAPHEDMTPLLDHPNNQNIAITLHDKVTHPGDSLQITETSGILLLPIDGPWGSTADAAKLIDKLKPQYVLPIHDAMYTDQWRGMTYGWIEDVCKRTGANFLSPEPGKPIDVKF